MTSNRWWLQMLRCAHTLINGHPELPSNLPVVCLVSRHALAKRHIGSQLKLVTPVLLDASTCDGFNKDPLGIHTDSAAEHYAMRVLSRPRPYCYVLTRL